MKIIKILSKIILFIRLMIYKILIKSSINSYFLPSVPLLYLLIYTNYGTIMQRSLFGRNRFGARLYPRRPHNKVHTYILFIC